MLQLHSVFAVKPEEIDQLCSSIDLCLDHRLPLDTHTHTHSVSLMLASSVSSDGPVLRLHLSDHGLGQDFCSLGSTDDISGLQQNLGSVLHRFQVPLSASRHRGHNGFIDELLHRSTRTVSAGLAVLQLGPLKGQGVIFRIFRYLVINGARCTRARSCLQDLNLRPLESPPSSDETSE